MSTEDRSHRAAQSPRTAMVPVRDPGALDATTFGSSLQAYACRSIGLYRCICYSIMYSTRDVIQVTGHSPNTIISYLKGMEDQGLIERVQGRRFGPGRPPIVHRVTPLGMSQWRSLETSAFLQ